MESNNNANNSNGADTPNSRAQQFLNGSPVQRVRTWLDAFGDDEGPSHSTPTSQGAHTHALRFLNSSPIIVSDSDESSHDDNSSVLTHDTDVDERGLYSDDDAWVSDTDVLSETNEEEQVTTTQACCHRARQQ